MKKITAMLLALAMILCAFAGCSASQAEEDTTDYSAMTIEELKPLLDTITDGKLTQQLTIIMTATLASIGTAGVPGSGVIMLAMVLESVGLPLEGIALVAGIDRILEMGRTVVNITGDASCAICVDALDLKRDRKKHLN